MKLALVGDIGGTNARFALWKNQQLQSVQVLATADHASPEEAISLYLSGLGLAPGSIGSVCLSVAGPVSGDEFKFTNNHWRLSRNGVLQNLAGRAVVAGQRLLGDGAGHDPFAAGRISCGLRGHALRAVASGRGDRPRPSPLRYRLIASSGLA